MSKYKTIQTEFRCFDSLKRALADMGWKAETAKDVKTNSLTLISHFKAYGGKDVPVAIRIPNSELNKDGRGFVNELGFAWDGRQYQLVMDHMLERYNPVVEQLNKLRQRYALHEVRRQARMKGYSVQEHVDPSGAIHLSLIRR